MAEAQIDLQRVRAVRHMLLDGLIEALTPPDRSAELREVIRLGSDMIRQGVSRAEAEAFVEKLLKPKPFERVDLSPERLAAISKDLARLARYERRALSRRKFAVRALEP